MGRPGILIDVPAHSAADAPAPIAVTMCADMAIYYANNGIIDRALQVVLVRRDAPGVGMLAKTDPKALWLPEPPLHAPPGVQDLPGEVSEHREFRLDDYDVRHDGAARYFVLGTFARWAAGPLPMEIAHPGRSVGAGDAGPAPPRTPRTERLFASRPLAPGVFAAAVQGPPQRIDGALRVPFSLPRFRGDAAHGPWVTVVVWQPSASGPVAALSQRLEPRTEGTDHVAAFSIEVERLAPRLDPGRARAWVFSGDHVGAPIDFEVAG